MAGVFAAFFAASHVIHYDVYDAGDGDQASQAQGQVDQGQTEAADLMPRHAGRSCRC